MMQEELVRCPNCGTEWRPETMRQLQGGIPAASYTCPTCNFRVSATTSDTSATPLALASIRDLEDQLRLLIDEARLSGLDEDSIAGALRNELEFITELGHLGHRFSVQIIDLGPQDFELTQRPLRDRREILQTRSVGQ